MSLKFANEGVQLRMEYSLVGNEGRREWIFPKIRDFESAMGGVVGSDRGPYFGIY